VLWCTAVTPEELEIFTLKADNTMTSVFYANLTDIVDRWSCVVAAVNILTMFIGQRWVLKSIRFGIWHNRNNKHIRLDPRFTEVEFSNIGEFNRMRAFYSDKIGVPHLEHNLLDPSVRVCSSSYALQRVLFVPTE
jgi:hypothetical protein